MLHNINCHTIARTPVDKISFAKLSLKKKKDSASVDKMIKQPSTSIRKEEKETISSSHHKLVSTPPFVTKRRKNVTKNISPLFADDCYDDKNDESENLYVFNDKKVDKLDHNNLNSQNVDELNSKRQIENNNHEELVKEEIPVINYSNVTPESANILNSLYGDVWRSTPGLFKRLPRRAHDEDSLNEQFNTLNINGKNGQKDDEKEHIEKDVSFDWLSSIGPQVDEKKVEENVRNDNIKEHFNEIERKSTRVNLTEPEVDNEKGESGVESNRLNLNEPKINDKKSDDLKKTDITVKGYSDDEAESVDGNSFTESDDILLKPNRLNFNSCDSDSDDVVSKIKTSLDRIYPIQDDKKKLKITAKKKNKNANKNKENVEPVTKSNVLDEVSSARENLRFGFMASLADNLPTWRRDIEAKFYRDNFKTKKEELAGVLYKMFNENVFGSKLHNNLPIVWNVNLTTTAGRAHNKMVRSKGEIIGRKSRIELSCKVIDTAQRLRDTLAHELCHVATWLIDGNIRDGHGPMWKAWVSKILQRYPEIGTIPVRHNLDIYHKYTYKCMKCGYRINRHSKSLDVAKKRCGYCYGSFECIHNKKMKDGLIVSTPSKSRKEANGFALFVKENYGNVRSGSTPHKDVMKYLGKQYAELKGQSNKT